MISVPVGIVLVKISTMSLNQIFMCLSCSIRYLCILILFNQIIMYVYLVQSDICVYLVHLCMFIRYLCMFRPGKQNSLFLRPARMTI